MTLVDYLETLWVKGFKLPDEDIRFIYFGKKLTNADDWCVSFAIETTLRLKRQFDGSFYISLLELFHEHEIKNRHEAKRLLAVKNMT